MQKLVQTTLCVFSDVWNFIFETTPVTGNIGVVEFVSRNDASKNHLNTVCGQVCVCGHNVVQLFA